MFEISPPISVLFGAKPFPRELFLDEVAISGRGSYFWTKELFLGEGAISGRGYQGIGLLRVLAETKVSQNNPVRQNVSLQLDFGIARKETDLFESRILHSSRPGMGTQIYH
jgi:hypothetical protein